MKKLIFIIFLVLFQAGYSQEYKTHINTDFLSYLSSIVEGDYEKSVNFIDEALFEFVTKELMVSFLEQTMNNPAYNVEFKDARILSIEDAEVIEQKYYSLLRYSNFMLFKFNPGEYETVEEQASQNEILKLSFQNSFGAENVEFDPENETFRIYVEKEAYATSVNGISNWKFVVIEKEQKAMLEKILPQELLGRI